MGLLRHPFWNGLTKCLHMCRLQKNLYCSQPKGLRVYVCVLSLDIEEMASSSRQRSLMLQYAFLKIPLGLFNSKQCSEFQE